MKKAYTNGYSAAAGASPAAPTRAGAHGETQNTKQEVHKKMKKYVKFGHTLYEVVDLAGAVFQAALVAMLASATWLALDWLARNSISMWAVFGLITGMTVAGIITAIFRNYSK